MTVFFFVGETSPGNLSAPPPNKKTSKVYGNWVVVREVPFN